MIGQAEDSASPSISCFEGVLHESLDGCDRAIVMAGIVGLIRLALWSSPRLAAARDQSPAAAPPPQVQRFLDLLRRPVGAQ